MDIFAFGQRLKVLRGERSQAEIVALIASKTGVPITAQTLGRYERGERKPDIEIVEALATTFEISADYLLCRTNVKTPEMSIQAICDYTGFSEDAIAMMERVKKYRYYSLDILNILLETGQIYTICSCLAVAGDLLDSYKNEIEKCERRIEEIKNELYDPSDRLNYREDPDLCVDELEEEKKDNEKKIDEYEDKIKFTYWKFSQEVMALLDEFFE